MGVLTKKEHPLWVSALPLVVWWAGLPLWWALGLQRGAAVIAAVPLGLWVLARWRRIEMPGPLLAYAGFMAWFLLSAIALTTARYGASYAMRLTMYAAALIVAVYVWNALRRGMSPRPLLWAIVAMWASAVVLSLPGLIFPGLSFPSPTDWLLWKAGIGNEYLHASARPQFSEWDQVYGTGRPSPLFAYTNEWGAAMGLMTPVAIYVLATTRSNARRVALALMLALSIVPILFSLNRGCWISLGVAVAYVVGRRILAGDVRLLAVTVTTGAVGAALVLASPLADLIADRFEYANASTRATLYSASLRLALQSPVVGYGTPQSSAGIPDANGVSVGTHGQLWTLLVSQGFVGTALFVLALVAALWAWRPRHGRSPEVWLHAVGVVVLSQMPFYEVIPDGLPLAFVALAICATTAGHHRPDTPTPAADSPPAPEGRRDDLAHHV